MYYTNVVYPPEAHEEEEEAAATCTEHQAPMSAASVLQHSAEEGVDILTKLSSICKSKYQCPPLSPSYVQEAKAIILLRSRKAGLGVGLRFGHGMLLTRMPARTGAAGMEPPQWSAPIFLKVAVGQVGFIMGYEQVDTFMLAMTPKLLDQLMAGSHTLLGVDQSMVMFLGEVEDKSDVIATASGTSDLVGVSHSSGVMLDFSLSGGSMSINHNKMEEVYGPGVGMAEVMKGGVPPPAEMAPLYNKLAELVVGGNIEKISAVNERVSASLERLTSGPERRTMHGERASGSSDTGLPPLAYQGQWAGTSAPTVLSPAAPTGAATAGSSGARVVAVPVQGTKAGSLATGGKGAMAPGTAHVVQREA